MVPDTRVQGGSDFAVIHAQFLQLIRAHHGMAAELRAALEELSHLEFEACLHVVPTINPARTTPIITPGGVNRAPRITDPHLPRR